MLTLNKLHISVTYKKACEKFIGSIKNFKYSTYKQVPTMQFFRKSNKQKGENE